MTVHPVRNNDCQLAGNPGKKNIRFGRCVVSGLPPGSTHIDLEMVDGASSFGCAAGFLTIADPLPLYHMYFGADPFVAV